MTKPIEPPKKYIIKKLELPKKFHNESHKACYIALKSIVDKGERPDQRAVAKLAGFSREYLSQASGKEWKQPFNELIELKQQEWTEHGGIMFIKANEYIDDAVAKGELPTQKKAAKAMGISRSFLSKSPHPFLEKIKDRIKAEQKAYYDNKAAKEEAEALAKIPDGMVLLEPVGMNTKQLYGAIQQEPLNIEIFEDAGLAMVDIKTEPASLAHIMYTKRERVRVGNQGNRYYIFPESFNADRFPLMEALVLWIHATEAHISISSGVRFMLDFIDYCDMLQADINEPFLPLDPYQIGKAYNMYTLNLKQRMATEGLSSQSARMEQDFAEAFIKKLIFRDCENRIGKSENTLYNIIFRNVEKIKKKPSSPSVKKAIDVQKAITFYGQFFLQVTDFVLEPKTTFPAVINLKKSNEEADEKVRYLLAPFGKIQIHQEGKGLEIDPFRYYNIETAKLRPLKKILASIPCSSRTEARKYYLNYKTQLEAINTDPNHPFRLALAETAFKAFYLLLSALTGMKDSELVRIEWDKEGEEIDDEIKLEKTSSKGIVTIKPRAQYRDQNYTIQRYGAHLLRIALKLRRFLLQGHTFKYLFFVGIGENAHQNSNMLCGSQGAKIYKQLKNINPALPNVSTSALRLFKSNELTKQTNGNIFIAAMCLNHEVKVNIEKYQKRSKEETDWENHKFIEAMIQKARSPEEQKEAVDCGHRGEPDMLIETPIISCDHMFACLICKHFKPFADEEDIHKLLSMIYVLERVCMLRRFNNEQAKGIVKPIIEMALNWLKAMAKKYKCGQLINDIQKRVNHDRELHPWWEFKLHQLLQEL